MSLSFVTRKLETQKLEEEQEEQDKVVQSDIDGTNNGDSDSGTESDEEDEDCISNNPESKMFVPLPASAAAASEDNYSSEEELKEIINETSAKASPTASSAEALLPKKKSPSKKERKMKAKNNSNIKKDMASAAAEKRKWSEVISDDDLADLEDDGLELEMTSRSYSRVYVRSSGGNSTTASSSCSNEDESCVCGRRLTTPVQFCTSPPMDVHRPRRKPWTPPPPKVFHVMSNHSASFDLTTQEEDDEIVDIENRASRPLRPAAFMPVTTGNGNASTCNGMTSSTAMPSSSEFLEAAGAGSPAASSTGQYCPRHHHHTQGQQQQRQTPSPNKRHRLTPRPHNIQRPCLDFEKMQQIKKRVVTSWRPQGAELSLFCW